MFWTILNFALLVFILGKFAWKPILKALDEREHRMKAERQAAEEARTSAEQIRDELEAQLKHIAGKELAALQHAAKISESERDLILEAAREHAQKIIAKAKEELEAEKKKLVRELRSEVANLSLIAAERLINKEINRETHKGVVEQLFRDIESKGGHQ